MTQQFLRTVPAAILMTTALAWNLPATAQSTSGNPPTSRSAPRSTPAPGMPGGSQGTPSGDVAVKPASGLPADLQPTAPASSASAALPAGGASMGPGGMPARNPQ